VKLRKTDANGVSTIYEVIVPEGQTVEGEVVEDNTAEAEVAPVTLAPGTVVEGVGVANAEGLVVANDLLQHTAQRRKPPPPKRKKGGPGRGKKKVMFTGPALNEDASASATTGGADATAGDGAVTTNGEVATNGEDANGANGEGEGEGDDDEGEDGEEGEDGDDDDDREDGELSDTEVADVPASKSSAALEPTSVETIQASKPDVTMTDVDLPPPRERHPSSSPDLPLAQRSHSRVEIPGLTTIVAEPIVEDNAVSDLPIEHPETVEVEHAETAEIVQTAVEEQTTAPPSEVAAPAGESAVPTKEAKDDDLLGRFEKELNQ